MKSLGIGPVTVPPGAADGGRNASAHQDGRSGR
jgi:hypothetical protein